MSTSYYIAACAFTKKFPEISLKIQNYVKDRFNYNVVRCCVPKYKLEEYTLKMPEWYRDSWSQLKDSHYAETGDTVYSICHNCSAIIEEQTHNVNVKSIWELIAENESFKSPDYSGKTITVQDCWRAYDRIEEQLAVRKILSKMNIKVVELEKNFGNTEFCGFSLLQPCFPRNRVLAPKRYGEAAENTGKFIPHTDEQKLEIMKKHCSQITTDEVVCYCHYCLEGLQLGGANALHLAQLVFN